MKIKPPSGGAHVQGARQRIPQSGIQGTASSKSSLQARFTGPAEEAATSQGLERIPRPGLPDRQRDPSAQAVNIIFSGAGA